MALTITIAGTDRTTNCRFEKLRVVNSIVSNADTADLEVSISTTAGWRPQAGNTVIVTNGNTTEYGGVITEVAEVMLSGSWLKYQCACRDYTQLLDRLLVVTNTTAARPASAIVTDILTTYTSGFTSVNVKASPNVGIQTFDYVSVSQSIRSLADQLGWGFYVDYAKDVHFYDIATVTAPVAAIALDSNLTDYGGMRLTETIAQEKNKVYLKGFQQATNTAATLALKADGSQRFFPIGYVPGASSAITVTRTPAGATAITQTFNVDGRDGQVNAAVGGVNDIFMCWDNMGLRYDIAPASSDLITILAPMMQALVGAVEDTVAQSTMATREGGSGVHEHVIDDPSMTAPDGSDTYAQARGNLVLQRYAFPRLLGKFASYTQGWRAGQSLVISSTKRMGGFSKTFYVQEVTKTLINHPAGSTPLLRYDIQVADGPLPL